MKEYEDAGIRYVEPETANDVTPEMLTLAESIYDGYFDDEERIDWEEFVDRLVKEGYLADGRQLEFETYDSPAISKIRRHIREYRRL